MSRFHRHEWATLPELAFRPRPGGGMTLEGDSGSPPPPDPRQFDIMEKQVAQGDDLISFIKKSYDDNQPRIAAQDALNDKVIKSNLDMSQKASDRADDSYNFYKTEGQPVISQALNDAKNWDSAGNIDQARNSARADAQAGIDSAQAQQTRTLQRMGVNPSSAKFAALNNQMALQKASATAGAANAAGEQRKLQAVGLRQQAGNLASGMPAQSMGFSGQAGGFGTSASGVGASGVAGAMGVQNQASSGMQAGANIYGSAAGQYGNLYGTQMQGYGMKSSADASEAAGAGALIGTAAMMMMADGGTVKGPGTGTSDSVPAVNVSNGQPIRLSNGEYVVPADVVKAKGVEFFDKLKQRYHAPVRQGNLGRATA